MKLRLYSQTLAQHYIKSQRWGTTGNSGYLQKHSHNTTLKPEGEKEHELRLSSQTLAQHYIKPGR